MPNKSALRDRITKLASENNLVLPPSTSGSVADAERRLDSIALLELLVALEQEFQISLMDEEFDAADRLKSMEALTDLLVEKLDADGN